MVMSGLSFLSLSSPFWNPGQLFCHGSLVSVPTHHIELNLLLSILYIAVVYLRFFGLSLCFTGGTVNSFRALLVLIFLPCLLQASELTERLFYLPVSHGETLVTFCPSSCPCCLLHSNCPVKNFSRYKSIFCLCFSFLNCFSDHSLFWGDVFLDLLKPGAHSFHTNSVLISAL